MVEVWKDIKDYEELYYVSNLGRVKNSKGLIKSNRPCTNGYLKTTLSKNGKKTTLLLHRLVANAFISNPNNYSQVNHIDGVKTNNLVDNLEWCDQKYNMQHALKTGLSPKGENSARAKHTEDQILQVIELYNKGYGRKEIIEITGVTFSVVKGVRAKKRWKHLSHLLEV